MYEVASFMQINLYRNVTADFTPVNLSGNCGIYFILLFLKVMEGDVRFKDDIGFIIRYWNAMVKNIAWMFDIINILFREPST